VRYECKRLASARPPGKTLGLNLNFAVMTSRTSRCQSFKFPRRGQKVKTEALA